MTLTYSDTTQIHRDERHCEQCNARIPRHRLANTCAWCEGRIGGYPIGASCPFAVALPLAELPPLAFRLTRQGRWSA